MLSCYCVVHFVLGRLYLRFANMRALFESALYAGLCNICRLRCHMHVLHRAGSICASQTCVRFLSPPLSAICVTASIERSEFSRLQLVQQEEILMLRVRPGVCTLALIKERLRAAPHGIHLCWGALKWGTWCVKHTCIYMPCAP